MPGTSDSTVHQLKIGLQGTTPPLWRRILVPSAASLGFLHDVIQQAFDWEDCHLHRFYDDRGREWDDRESSDEEETDLGQVLRAEGAVLGYDYDFGDDWRHRIEVEKIMPLDPAVRYPRCTAGRRAAPPAEDIGGVWGLEEIVYLVSHPEEEPPEHLEDLVASLRDEGYDPSAFDPVGLTSSLTHLNVRTAAEPAAPVEAEVFPAVMLPPPADLAAQARLVPLVGDALRLARWCAPGRPVTPKGVLKPAVAREAVEELRLWDRSPSLAEASVRANALSSLRSAGDLPVLDDPWQLATGNGLIAIRSGRAVPGPQLPDPDDSDGLLSLWQDAFAEELGALDDLGPRLLPGVLSLLGQELVSVVSPTLKLLYRLADGEWLTAAALSSALGAKADGTALLEALIVESTTRLLTILADFGAADVDWGTTSQYADEAGLMMLFPGNPAAKPDYRMRLTPLGRHGVRNLLLSQGHRAHAGGELATADAAALLDALASYDAPAAFDAELTGWLTDQDEATAVTQLLDAVTGTEPDLARRRVTAIRALTVAKPDDAREVLRNAAANGPDGRRHVAAGVLANLGEEPPLYRQAGQQWLLVDLLTALRADDLRDNLPPGTLEDIRAHADDLWRGGHPSAVGTLEATADALRDSDKILAKRLRRCAHKARGQATTGRLFSPDHLYVSGTGKQSLFLRLCGAPGGPSTIPMHGPRRRTDHPNRRGRRSPAHGKAHRPRPSARDQDRALAARRAPRAQRPGVGFAAGRRLLRARGDAHRPF
jgi:Plasmid pRiA4b ORF-3-like protein